MSEQKLTLNKVIELIKPGFDLSKVKLVRHIDNSLDFKELIKKDLLEEYQNAQGKKIFHDCSHIISFVADGGSRSIFYGVYEIINKPEHPKDFRSNCSEELGAIIFKDNKTSTEQVYFYEMKRDDAFEELSQRLVIDWGEAAISWHQWANNKDKNIIEVLPVGYTREFPGFLDFVLDFKELKNIIDNPDENKIWHQMLSSVFAVYLITDRKTGLQYVGSAYGENADKGGLFGRWKNYVSTGGHGGNKQLVALLNKDSNYAANFSFTILRTLPKTLTKDEVIRYENLYKQKLGSKVFGLNSN